MAINRVFGKDIMKNLKDRNMKVLSVSYTHLDVYKRQKLGLAIACVTIVGNPITASTI